MENRLHVIIGIGVGCIVESQTVLVRLADTALVEDAEHLLKPVVHLTAKPGYLHDNAVVVQAVDEPVGNAPHDRFVVVVVHLLADIYHGVLNLAHTVSQQVHGHHGQRMAVRAVGYDVLGILVVNAQILTEAQGLRRQPCLLQFYQYQMLFTVVLSHCGAEVDAEDGKALLLPVGVFMRAYLHLHYIFLQQR